MTLFRQNTEFGDSAAQTRLPFFAIVHVSGEDRAAFTHGQLSNDINHLAESSACHAIYDTPEDRVLASMLVLNRGSDLLLVMAADLTEAVVKRLHVFVLRIRVVFKPLPDCAAAIVLNESAEAHAAAESSLSFLAVRENSVWTVSLPCTGRLKIREAERLPEHDAAAGNTWDLHKVRSGYAWISTATKETAVAQMLNRHIIGDVYFKKGCYPGQEIIARAQYRRQVKRGLVVLSGGSLETAGITVLEDDTGADQIISTALTDTGSLSLVVIKYVTAQAVLTDANGNSLKQEKLSFNVEPKE